MNTGNDFDDIKGVAGINRTSTLTDDQKTFLRLALKEISGHATEEERKELRQLMKNPDYRRMKRDIESDDFDEFLESCLKVLIGTPRTEEVSRMRTLKESNPARWRQFLRIGDILQGMATPPEPENVEPEPMPEIVRSKLRAELKRVRADRQSRK